MIVILVSFFSSCGLLLLFLFTQMQVMQKQDISIDKRVEQISNDVYLLINRDPEHNILNTISNKSIFSLYQFLPRESLKDIYCIKLDNRLICWRKKDKTNEADMFYGMCTQCHKESVMYSDGICVKCYYLENKEYPSFVIKIYSPKVNGIL